MCVEGIGAGVRGCGNSVPEIFLIKCLLVVGTEILPGL